MNETEQKAGGKNRNTAIAVKLFAFFRRSEKLFKIFRKVNVRSVNDGRLALVVDPVGEGGCVRRILDLLKSVKRARFCQHTDGLVHRCKTHSAAFADRKKGEQTARNIDHGAGEFGHAGNKGGNRVNQNKHGHNQYTGSAVEPQLSDVFEGVRNDVTGEHGGGKEENEADRRINSCARTV